MVARKKVAEGAYVYLLEYKNVLTGETGPGIGRGGADPITYATLPARTHPYQNPDILHQYLTFPQLSSPIRRLECVQFHLVLEFNFAKNSGEKFAPPIPDGKKPFSHSNHVTSKRYGADQR
ncbi:MAG: hypothetical protein R2788_26510 [Saprospiraceae bacterium]